MPAISRVWGIYVSEGGLGPRPWWYIPKPGIYHQSKLPRQGPPGPASRRRIAAAPPGPHAQSEHLACGNDDRGSAGIELARTGRRHPHRGAPSSGRQGDSLPLLPEDSAPQPQPPRTSPDDLAAELNPHKTELNPHKAVEAASRARTAQPGLPSSGQSPPARQLAKAELSRRPRSAVPMTLRYRHRPSLRTRTRRYGRLLDGGMTASTAPRMVDLWLVYRFIRQTPV